MNPKNKKKRLILLIVALVLIAALLVGLWMFLQYRNDQKTVEVIPVSQITDFYWGDPASTSGRVVNDYVQQLFPDSNKVVSETFVEEGQEVRIGDPLLQYDKDSLELEVEYRTVALSQADLDIETAQKQLRKLQNTKPAATPGPTARPTATPRATATPRPTARPTGTPRPTAAPTATPAPTPIPTPSVTLYSRLDLNSMPYKGAGTSQDPYVFLCTEDCVITPEFFQWLMGAGKTPEPTATPSLSPSVSPSVSPAPSEEPEESSEPDEEESGEPEDGASPSPSPSVSPSPTPTPTPRPGSRLASPFAAVFEVREGNSNYGKLISAFKLDGTQTSGAFVPEGQLRASATLETVAILLGATPTPSPTPEPDNYNDMGYTAAELSELITEKREEIRNLQLARRQAKLDLDKANLQLTNSTVLSTVDGTVTVLMDVDEARQQSKPFLVVSGSSGSTYVVGALSENVLGVIQVDDTVSVTDYRTGNAYSARIVGISDYPLDSDSGLYYYGTGNPNSSNYEFTAVVTDPADDLVSGQDIQIDLTVQDEESANALYIQNPYIREDEGGSYVMKAGINNRLVKQYVKTGRSLYGYSTEVRSGLTMNDYVAFPYGPDVKEGVRVRVQGEEDGPMTGTAGTEEVWG